MSKRYHMILATPLPKWSYIYVVPCTQGEHVQTHAPPPPPPHFCAPDIRLCNIVQSNTWHTRLPSIPIPPHTGTEPWWVATIAGSQHPKAVQPTPLIYVLLLFCADRTYVRTYMHIRIRRVDWSKIHEFGTKLCSCRHCELAWNCFNITLANHCVNSTPHTKANIHFYLLKIKFF